MYGIGVAEAGLSHATSVPTDGPLEKLRAETSFPTQRYTGVKLLSLSEYGHVRTLSHALQDGRGYG